MSGKIFIISDLHYSHRNMAIKRGFKSLEQHDQCIIDSWNNVVSKKDVVWLLGDITMEKSNYEFLNQLKGFKKVVLGNHDKPQHVPKLLKYVNNVSGMVQLKSCILTHCPIHESELDRFKLNIHGHVHENSLEDKRYFNVSAEVLNYKPIELNEILKNV